MGLHKKKYINIYYRVILIASASLTALLFSLESLNVHAEENEETVYTDRQGIQYELYNDGACMVTGYTDEIQSSIYFPEKIKAAGENYKVKGIEKYAFDKCSMLKQITIPDSMSDLEAGVFDGCKKLKQVRVVPVGASAKKSGRTMVIPLKVNPALLGGTADVRLDIDKGVIGQAVLHGQAAEKIDEITLVISVADRDGSYGGGKGRGRVLLPDGIVLRDSAVRAAADSGKDLKIRMKDLNGAGRYIKINAGSRMYVYRYDKKKKMFQAVFMTLLLFRKTEILKSPLTKAACI